MNLGKDEAKGNRSGAPRLRIGNRVFDFASERPLVMGILNVTPDSFYDGGLYSRFSDAVRRGLRMIEEGADIIDVGGESTRPGSQAVYWKEEVERVIPVIKELKKETGAIISIDTYKPEVAFEALEAGADLINDVYGLRQPGMLDLAAGARKPVVIMHMKGTPQTMQDNPVYENVIQEVYDFLLAQRDKAFQAGLRAEEVIVDVGIGFGKTLEHNLELIRHLDYFKKLGCPVLLGPSRKSFLGLILDLPPEERLEGTLAVVAIAVLKGANILRVHDVKEALRAVKVAFALKENRALNS